MFAGISDNPWNEEPRRGGSTLSAFALQSLAVLLLVALPLIYPQSMADFHISSALLAPISAPHTFPGVKQSQGAGVTVLKPTSIWLRRPDYLPRESQPDSGQPQPPGWEELGIGNSPNAGPAVGIWNGMGSRPLDVVAPPPVPIEAPKPRVSRMMEGNLMVRVQPDYPPLARQARVQGSVILRAIISREGTIEHLQAISGSPMLVEAAIRAVRQWRYRPYVLNDQPVEVETQITVNFTLNET
jgi:protein TonB